MERGETSIFMVAHRAGRIHGHRWKPPAPPIAAAQAAMTPAGSPRRASKARRMQQSSRHSPASATAAVSPALEWLMNKCTMPAPPGDDPGGEPNAYLP